MMDSRKCFVGRPKTQCRRHGICRHMNCVFGILFHVVIFVSLFQNTGGTNPPSSSASSSSSSSAAASSMNSYSGSCSSSLFSSTSSIKAVTKDNLRPPSGKSSPPFVSPNLWLPDIMEPYILQESSSSSSSSLDDLEDEVMNWSEIRVCMGVSEDDSDTSSDRDGEGESEGDEHAIEGHCSKFPKLHNVLIGRMPQFETSHALRVLDVAVTKGWNGGYGVWPQMTLQQRIVAIENVLDKLQHVREEIITILQYEIGKNVNDATAEFDRTILFARQLISTIRSDPQFYGSWTTSKNPSFFIKRAAIGVILCLAPYNYPINESYAELIPALLMGNVVILKIPTIGGLAHLLTMQAFRESLPPYTMNFIAGSGRKTMPPLVATGKIDGLAFIGSAKAANQLIHTHPNPHRLKLFLQLEAKNMAIFMDSLFNDPITSEKYESALDHALNEAITGTLSYNGQRCTALKLLFVPTQHATKFIEHFVNKVSNIPVGLPWQLHNQNVAEGDTTGALASSILSKITPLPTLDRIKYMKELIEDAISKGAKIMNPGGGTVLGGSNSTLMIPAIIYPVTSEMKLFTVEQFGPIIPIATYDTIDTVMEYAQEGVYAQQVSIFTNTDYSKFDTTKGMDDNGDDATLVAQLIDKFSPIFGKININGQCGRSPDTIPFSGRRSSAMGVMSVRDALLEFSIPTVVAYRTSTTGNTVEDDSYQQSLNGYSKFLQSLPQSQ